jgi:hypothetical protein
MDEDVWDEFVMFQKCLVDMWAAEGKVRGLTLNIMF